MTKNIDEIIEKAKKSDFLIINKELTINEWNKISKLTHLKKLQIEASNNNNLPESLSNLKNLEYFSLNHDKITKIPLFITKIPKLEKLFFLFTRITDFSALNKVPNLKDLRLAGSNLYSAPNEIFNLENLEHLDLSRNKIKHFPKKLFQLPKLNNLYLEDNPIDALQFGYLINNRSLNFTISNSSIFQSLNFKKILHKDNLIYFEQNDTYGFIRNTDIHEIERYRHREFKKYDKETSGILINIFGDFSDQQKILVKIRNQIENWLEKNEIQYKPLTSKSGKTQKTSCMRFFSYRGNLPHKEIRGREFVIDFEKLLEYKSLKKNTYFDDEHGREIDVDELLKYIGAEREKLIKPWNGEKYITKIEIENFKVFTKIHTELSKNINILIGKNGLGKTSFLQSLALGLLPLSNIDKSTEFEKYISFNFNKSDITLCWGAEYRKVLVYKNELRHENYLDFPQKLILAYGVNLNTDEKLSHTDITQHLIQGNALPYSTKSIFKDYSTDFYDPLIVLERLFIEKKGKENKLIDSMIKLIKNTLNDFLGLFTEPEKISLESEYADYYFIDLNSNKLKTENLSEGYKDFILQVTDIIIRIIASRNSIIENKKTDITIDFLKNVNGVIIIDEFDRHLHPVLQRNFLDKLSEYFCNIQFVLSTHNIFSFQSAEGHTALIINTIDKKLNINHKEITKGLSLESIYNQYFNGSNEIYGNTTEQWLKEFKKLIDKQRKQELTDKEKKEFKKITNDLLNYGESIKGIVTREIRQFERLTGKTIEL